MQNELLRSPVGPEHSSEINPAASNIDEVVRPILGSQIADFWLTQVPTWNQRFVRKSLSALMVGAGEVPKTKAKTDQEATPAVQYKLEHWMIGANINVAGNLAIAYASAGILQARKNPSKELQIDSMLDIIGGAQARIRWEKKHADALSGLSDQLAIDQENARYKSPLAQLTYLQRSQKAYSANRRKVLRENKEQFFASIERKQLAAMNLFNTHSASTNTVLGRDDKGFCDINFYGGPWNQLGLVEESTRKGHEPKGISVTFYRYSQETGEKEFFVCWGKRDAFARTHQLTPAWQTSMTRVEKGNHPSQDYNPILDSLKHAFSNAYASNGVEISYIDPNPNRQESSPIAVATIDWSNYSSDDQQKILDLMAKENKGLKHSWISEVQLAQLRRLGLVDNQGMISPAINGFLAIALGSRSPKEILHDAANRLAQSEVERLMDQYPAVSLEFVRTELDQLLEVQETSVDTRNITLTILQIIATQQSRLDQIEAAFPHASHRLDVSN